MTDVMIENFKQLETKTEIRISHWVIWMGEAR